MNEETRYHSQGRCLSSCSADPSGASSAVRIDYSDRNGSTWLDFDLQGDDEEMTVKREILDPWAFAAPSDSLYSQDIHILQDLPTLH